MSGRLRDEVENTVDQLLRLALEDVFLTASAADQWLADLDDADTFEQLAAYHGCFLSELQRIAARDMSRRLEIAAAWFGAPTRRIASAGPAVDPKPDSEPVAERPLDPVPLSPAGAATVAGAMLDATNLKHLRDVLYGPSAGRWELAEGFPRAEEPRGPVEGNPGARAPLPAPRRRDGDVDEQLLRA